MDENVEAVVAQQDVVLSEPTIVRRGSHTLTYEQAELASIAERLIEVRKAKSELAEMEHRLMKDQDRILDRIEARGFIAQFPNAQQRQAIKIYEKASAKNDPETLSLIFDLCCESGAHLTSWRSDQGEHMMVHYSRRIAEMGG